ncbi:polysaccharide deacetylase family protein [Actinospica robiniae]|uniref:polysaccharide deacetylase family protein n=1 Tax=Actinospica robiniae TaxID=304901 RepID=UPI00041B5660|nr:polysaccharide deacetylase family protein [Actinospica robiniae]
MTDPQPHAWSRRRFTKIMGGAASLATLGTFASACDGPAGSPTSAQAANAGVTKAPTTAASPQPKAAAQNVVDAQLLSSRYGLKPFLPAPPPPTAKAIHLDPNHPTTFSDVPASEKIVFVTIDDGIDKDPAFIQMVKDFKIPLTLSLADTLIRDDYAYFEKLYETGFVSIQNHTVTHPLEMPGLSFQQQLDEVAGQQVKLKREYGVTPYIFRPPGGNYNETTRAAVRQAGLKGMMMWREAMEIEDMEYQTSRRQLNPGDIILCHFRGPAQLKGKTMVQMMTNLYRHIQAQGFAVADVTQYV